MLEFVVPEQFEEQAKALICENAVRFAPKNRAKILEDIINEFKDGEIAPKMSAYSVKYNEDGTATVKPLNIGFAGNEYALLNVIENEGQTFMLSKEGKSVCIAPFELNGVSYLRTYDPADAPTIRETLGATLTPPKEPSFYDKICDFFATHILKRPGKAVQEYNDKKAYYDAMRKGLENLTGISDKVAGHKQEHADELKRSEQQQLEKQQELEKQKEQERLQQEKAEELRKQLDEDARRKAQEETRRKIEEEQQRQRDQLRQEKEAQSAKFAPEKEKAMMEAEKRINAARLQTVRDLQHSLPKKITERESLVTQQARLKKEIEEDEKNLKIVKDDLARKERWLQNTQKNLTEAKNTLKDLAKDLEEMAKLKELQPKKTEQKRNLEAAEAAIPVWKAQIKEADENYKKCADEYSKVSGAGHIYVMTPEQYLQYNYNQAKAGREQMLQQQRAVLTAKMKEVEEQLQSRDLSKKEIGDQRKGWEYIPILNLLSDKRELLKTEDALKTDLEKQYKALQNEDAELLKDFEEREAQHKALALDFSPENLKRTGEFLQTGLADTKAKHQAFIDAGKRVDKLKEHLAYSRGDRTTAQRELDRLNRESNGKDYNEELHNRTQVAHDQLNDQVNSLTRERATVKSEVNKNQKLVENAEFNLQQKKDSLPKMETRFHELDNEIDHGMAQITQFTRELRKAGIAVESAPGMQQAQQPQPKSPVVGGTMK